MDTETRSMYRGRLGDLRCQLDAFYGGEDSPHAAEYGTDGPGALSIERETVYRIVLGTGGPHDEVAVHFDAYGAVTGGEYRYYWSGMYGHGTTPLDREEAQEWADAYGLADRIQTSHAE